MEQTTIPTQTNLRPNYVVKLIQNLSSIHKKMDTKTKLGTYALLVIIPIAGFVTILKLLPSESSTNVSSEQVRELSLLIEQEKQVKLNLIEEKNKLSQSLKEYSNLRAQRDELKKKQDDTINKGLSEEDLNTIDEITTEKVASRK